MKKQDILARCLTDVQSGRATVDDCLARYPRLAGELRPLLEIAINVRPVGAPASEEFKKRVRRHLVETMRIDGVKIGVRSARRHRFALRVATGLAGTLIVSALGTAGTVYAAQTSLPGDTLYPVKTTAEQVQLALTLNHEQKAFLHLKLANRRIDEVAALTERRPEADVAAPAQAAAEQLDSSVAEMGRSLAPVTQSFAQRLSSTSFQQQVVLDGLMTTAAPEVQPALQSTIDVLRRSKLIADVTYDNGAFLDAQPSVQDETIEADRFEVTGTLTAVNDQTWHVDGVTLNDVTYAGKPPAANTRVRITGVARDGRVFVTRVDAEQSAAAHVSVTGVFQGASGNGTMWNVGGIMVPVADNGTAPPVGNNLHIKGTDQAGVVNVSQLEVRQSTEKGVQIEGKLSRVDQGSGAITLMQAGVKVRVYTGKAVITGGDNDRLSLADLKGSEGADVRVSGVYRQFGSLHARGVNVR